MEGGEGGDAEDKEETLTSFHIEFSEGLWCKFGGLMNVRIWIIYLIAAITLLAHILDVHLLTQRLTELLRSSGIENL